MKKVAFDFYFDETPLYLEVAKKLKEKYNVEIFGATMGQRWNRELSKYDFEYHNISEYISKNWDKIQPTKENLNYLFEKYGKYNVTDYIFADRFIVHFKWDYALALLIGHIKFWEYFIEKVKPEVFLGPGIAFLSHLTCYMVCKEYNVVSTGMYSTRIPNERFVLCHNRIDSWDKTKKFYEEMLEKGWSNPDDKNKMEEFLQNFIKNREVPSYMKHFRQSPHVKKESIREFVSRMKRYYIEGWRKDKYDYITKHPLWYVKREMKRILKAKIHRRYSFFEKPAKDERFFLFPLHLQPEGSTLVLAKYYVNQIAAIENIAKSMPITHKLYVKEHFSAIGRRTKDYYKQILKIKNVRLLSSELSSHDLIKQADGIIVLSSTMGWEGLLYEKPVISLGNAFYNDTGLVYKVNAYDDLYNILTEALKHPKKDRNKLLMFLHSIFKGTMPGRFNVPHADFSVTEESNLQLLADGIYAYFSDN